MVTLQISARSTKMSTGQRQGSIPVPWDAQRPCGVRRIPASSQNPAWCRGPDFFDSLILFSFSGSFLTEQPCQAFSNPTPALFGTLNSCRSSARKNKSCHSVVMFLNPAAGTRSIALLGWTVCKDEAQSTTAGRPTSCFSLCHGVVIFGFRYSTS